MYGLKFLFLFKLVLRDIYVHQHCFCYLVETNSTLSESISCWISFPAPHPHWDVFPRHSATFSKARRARVMLSSLWYLLSRSRSSHLGYNWLCCSCVSVLHKRFHSDGFLQTKQCKKPTREPAPPRRRTRKNGTTAFWCTDTPIV